MLHNIIQVVEEKIMARTKSDNVQINISIPTGWKTELENLARIYSVEEGKTITFLDLMRRGIQEKYQLGEAICKSSNRAASEGICYGEC
jgi:hypothetical protein